MRYVDLPHGNAALAIFPSTEGFGWMVFDGPLSPVRWGVTTVAKASRGDDRKNARCMKRVEHLLKQFTPPVIVLEAFEGKGTRRYERIKRLCRSVIAASTMRGATVRILSREEITKTFASTKPKTRHAVASTIAPFLPEIQRKLPKLRRAWEAASPNMALFSAAALLIVHYANPTEPL